MNPAFFHHVNCPKCHGTGSWTEQERHGDTWSIIYHLHCNCFKHMQSASPTPEPAPELQKEKR